MSHHYSKLRFWTTSIRQPNSGLVGTHGRGAATNFGILATSIRYSSIRTFEQSSNLAIENRKMSRALRDRLIHELQSIRKELIEAVTPIEDLDYAPAEGMKAYADLLKEIGAMEAESSIFLRTGNVPKWQDAKACVTGSTTKEILESFQQIRSDLLEWLNPTDDEHLRAPIPIPEDWWDFFGDQEIEREELLRWVARHEYYHLGQIVSYRWVQGFNPYEE